MLKEISAGIIIYRKTEEGLKFLILYHGRGYWNFPKGKIESEEKSFQTALREIKEETGLNRGDLRFNQNFKTYEKFNFWRPAKRDSEKIENNSQRVFKTVIFYLAETKRKAIKISETKGGQPHEGFGWFTYREAIKILGKHKDGQKILKQDHETLRK
ncbi:MAG: NUDIX domain-containing protein [bacterium]|nr:NUDIX domain-containing protein [bacterium]